MGESTRRVNLRTGVQIPQHPYGSLEYQGLQPSIVARQISGVARLLRPVWELVRDPISIDYGREVTEEEIHYQPLTSTCM